MPRFICDSCGTRLYSAARTADLIDPGCPACAASADAPRVRDQASHVRSTSRTWRPSPIGVTSTGHQRVADHFGAFMARGREAQARHEPWSHHPDDWS
jgi:hypothetical protein